MEEKNRQEKKKATRTRGDIHTERRRHEVLPLCVALPSSAGVTFTAL